MKVIMGALIVFSMICIFYILGIRKTISKKNNCIDSLNDTLKKQREFYGLFVRWLSVHNHGKSLASYFNERNIKNVAIYGMKETGVLLLSELERGGINVLYGIDRDADSIFAKTNIIKPSEDIKEVDAIVVTAIHYYNQIENDLKEKVDCPIFSLQDILYEISLL